MTATTSAAEATPRTAGGLGWPLADGVPSGGLGWPTATSGAPTSTPTSTTAAGEESA